MVIETIDDTVDLRELERRVVETALCARNAHLAASKCLVGKWDRSRAHSMHEWRSEFDRIGATPLFDVSHAAKADAGAAIDALIAARAAITRKED